MSSQRLKALHRQELRTTDTRLRPRPPGSATLVERMRAGRLATWRVALAAWLDDPQALSTGVEPWGPPAHLPHLQGSGYRAAVVLELADMPAHARIWLAAAVVDEVVSRCWTGGDEPAQALAAARAWCRGEGSFRAMTAAGQSARQAASARSRAGDSSYDAGRAAGMLYMLFDEPRRGSQVVRAVEAVKIGRGPQNDSSLHDLLGLLERQAAGDATVGPGDVEQASLRRPGASEKCARQERVLLAELLGHDLPESPPTDWPGAE